MNLFEQYFMKHLNEDVSTAAMYGDASGMTSVYSGDHYAPDDARKPKALGAKKKKKKNKDEPDVEMVPVIKRPFPETIFLTGQQ